MTRPDFLLFTRGRWDDESINFGDDFVVDICGMDDEAAEDFLLATCDEFGIEPPALNLDDYFPRIWSLPNIVAGWVPWLGVRMLRKRFLRVSLEEIYQRMFEI